MFPAIEIASVTRLAGMESKGTLPPLPFSKKLSFLIAGSNYPNYS